MGRKEMNIFSFFKKDKNQEKNKRTYAKMMNGYTPIFSQFGENIYASDVVQQCVKCITDEVKKVQIKHIKEPELTEQNTIINRIETELINFQQIKSNIAKEIVDMENAQKEFKNIKDGFLEEFEKIKREIKEDLNPDTYLTLSDKQNKIEESIIKLENKQKTINDIKNRIKSNLKERRELILKSCNIYETKIVQINESQDSIKISFIPNGNKEKFIEDLKVLIKGSGIRIDSISKIVDEFVDYIGILKDFI